MISLLIKFLPLPRLLRFVSPRPRRTVVDADALADKLARLVDKLLRLNWWSFTSVCWKRAIVLYRYLALNGLETRIIFGVRRSGEHMLDGHSWLEFEGQPFLESITPDYIVTFSFPELPRTYSNS